MAGLFQNFKKRVEKEQEEWFALAQANVIKKILPVLDDFELAMKNVPTEEKENAWLEGFDILFKKFKKVFEDLGVEQIACDDAFDPELHEALMQVESKEYKSGQIVQVLNNGYTFKGKVLRVAKVSVAK